MKRNVNQNMQVLNFLLKEDLIKPNFLDVVIDVCLREGASNLEKEIRETLPDYSLSKDKFEKAIMEEVFKK